MPIMTVNEVRNHINTDAPDEAIQQLLDAETEAIEYLLGSVESDITETFNFLDYPDKFLVLKRDAVSITSVTEDDVALAATDYELLDGNRVLARKGWIMDTSYIYWGTKVTVVYTPRNVSKSGARALIYLMKIGLAQNGYDVERNPEFLLDPVDYHKERVRTLRSLQRYTRFA